MQPKLTGSFDWPTAFILESTVTVRLLGKLGFNELKLQPPCANCGKYKKDGLSNTKLKKNVILLLANFLSKNLQRHSWQLPGLGV